MYLTVWTIYTLYFHPLSRYPGPKLAAVTPLVHLLWDVRGKQHSIIKKLHDEYGDVVRIAPNSLVYRAAPAWRDIYGHRKKGHQTFRKDPALYAPTPNGVNAIITANDEQHTRMRRLLSHAFSSKALGEQEVILHTYADMLVDKLKGLLGQEQSPVVDMTRWLNYTTFDLIGDLAFGEPFGCLAKNRYHWWVLIITISISSSRPNLRTGPLRNPSRSGNGLPCWFSSTALAPRNFVPWLRCGTGSDTPIYSIFIPTISKSS